MFGRGNWAIVGLAKESLEAFRTSLEDQDGHGGMFADGGSPPSPGNSIPIRWASILSALPASTKSIPSD